MKTKVCTKCGKRKKLEKFRRQETRYTRKKDGVTNRWVYYTKKCETCLNSIRKQEYRASDFTQEKRRIYELHKEEIEAGVRRRLADYSKNQRRLRHPKSYVRSERRRVYLLHTEQIDAGAREAWCIYVNHHNYLHRHGITHKEHVAHIAARAEQCRGKAIARAASKAEWEQRMAYYNTPEFIEAQRLRKRARTQKQQRRKYHSNLNVKRKQNRNRRHAVEILTDGYVRRVLAHGTGLVPSDIPQELVELKREYMKVNRLLKENQA